MRSTTLALLARPVSGADRARFLLVTGSTAVAGGLLIAGARVARLTVDSNRAGTFAGASAGPPSYDLAPYVTQAGLRPGVVLGAMLLTVPVLALAVQALRVGSVARERRLASLRLAGATPGDVRRVAAAEAGAAAALGGLLAGPAYGLLWLVLGLLLPSGSRLVPTPTEVDLLVWATVAAVTTVAGAAAAAVQGRVLADPLGVRRRAEEPGPRWGNRGALAVGAALLVGSWLALTSGGGVEFVVLGVLVLAVFLLAFAGGSRLVRRRGRRLQRRGGAEDLLAGARLVAGPQAPGRVAAVLGVAGLALGLEAVIVTDLFGPDGPRGEDLDFYLTGFGMAAVGVLVAAVVAVLTLLVGAADQLLDARRPLASLAALGVDQATLERVLRRQQAAIALPSVVIGSLLGGLGAALLMSDSSPGAAVPATLLTTALAAAVVSVAIRASARLLRGRLRAAIDPENLRVA